MSIQDKKNNLVEEEVYDRVLINIERKKAEKEKQEKDKKFILWSGVIFFMVLILAFWILNFKNSIAQTEIQSNNDFGWSEISNNFNGVIENVKSFLDSSNEEGEQEIDPNRLEELKGELEKIGANNDSATSTDFIVEEVGLPID